MKQRVVIIFGKTGTGKTSLSKQLIQGSTRVVAIDPKKEYNDFTVVDNLESFYDFVKSKNNFKVSCRFDNDLSIEYLFKIVYVLKNILLVVEEAEIYISPYAKSSSFLHLVRYGRHTNIQILGIARRASELSIDFRAQTDTMISLKQTEVADLKILEKYGFNNLDKLEQFIWSPKNKFPAEGKNYISINL